MSIEGESYEEWQARTAPAVQLSHVRPRWDLAVLALLAVFFVWVGGASGCVGLGLVAVMAAEQVLRRVLDRRGDASTPGLVTGLRAATLLVTLAMSAWLVTLMGGAAWGMPVLLVLFDLQDPSSVLRRVSQRGS